MKASDAIVKYLENKGIKHVFAYPGGMITHIMDSLSKSKTIKTHLTYHEQGAAFAACGYAQMKNEPTVVFTTSGPGATNLITGICDAWFDSIPVIFITGQVNTYEGRGDLHVRQKGFQETDIVSMVKTVTKYCVNISEPTTLLSELNKAYNTSLEGRYGPVLLDIPMNIQRAEIQETDLKDNCIQLNDMPYNMIPVFQSLLESHQRPCLILGNGMHCVNQAQVIKMVDQLCIPVVTSMPAVDVIPTDHKLNFGFIGAYGNRIANTIVEKSDLLITMGTRLDGRQTGANRDWFATNADILRLDIDVDEFMDKIKQNEIQLKCHLQTAVPAIISNIRGCKHETWLKICNLIKEKLLGYDKQYPNEIICKIGRLINPSYMITTDVGQNQVWVAQSFAVHEKQRILFSSGHGAMGYSLPAAIGACLASGNTVVSFNGDGGIQMNIQEFQTIKRENLSVKVIIVNNHSLGMIRHFQEMYFESNFTLTTEEKGYSTPDFIAIAKAYGICTMRYSGDEDNSRLIELLSAKGPCVIEVNVGCTTYTKPKSVYNLPLSYQTPLLDKQIQDWINSL